MGMDFVALIECHNTARDYDLLVDALTHDRLASVRNISVTWKQVGGAVGYAMQQNKITWVCRDVPRAKNGLIPWVEAPRPNLPNYDRTLVTPEDMWLVFGIDCVLIDHASPWLWFLTKDDWAEAMLEAVKDIAKMLESKSYIITHDFTCLTKDDGPFFSKQGYRECLLALEREGHGPKIVRGELYKETTYEGVPTWDTHGYLALTLG